MSERMRSADFHIHTDVSPDWLHETFGAKEFYTWREAIRTAARKGLTAMALTEHGVFHDYDKTQSFADREGVILVPAVELRGIVTEGGVSRVITKIFGRHQSTIDIIALGVVDPIPEATLELPELVDAIHQQDGLAVLAHPAFPWPALINWFSEEGKDLIRQLDIDAIEAFNAACLQAMNQKSQELAAELGLPVTGGSDTRIQKKIGIGATLFNDGVTVQTWQDCLQAIKNHQTLVAGKSRKLGTWSAKLGTWSAKLRAWLAQ